MKAASKKNLSALLFLIIGGLILASIFIQSPNPADFNRDFKNYNINLQILNDSQEKLAEFKVQIANNQYKARYGLMNLDYLPSNYGMLFDFKQEQIINMWMKNTRIPLDMIFIDKNNHIINIAANTRPYSLKNINSTAPAIMALEINGGIAEKFGIKAGDQILFNR